MTPRTLPYPMFTRKSVLGSACALLVACSSGGESRPDDGIPSLGETRLQLERAASCDELLTRIQDSIVVQLALRAEQLKQGEESYNYGPGIGMGGVAVDEDLVDVPRDPGSAPSGAPTPTPTGNGAVPPQAPAVPASDGEADAPAEEGGGFSGTTVQVADVDEADIVKTDGDRIYLLHGGSLFVLQGWPANATEVLGSTLVDGLPAEMFVSNGKAVVFSRVYGDVAGAASPDSYYYDSGYTKITVLDVSDGTPRVLRESFVEGEYSSSRRHGDVVRAVIQDGFKIPRLDSPAIEYRDAFGQPYPQQDIDAQVDAWLDRTTRSIRATDLGDWLPRELSQQGDDIVPVAPRCADYYSPDPGLTENGVTSVVALDLADVAAPFAGATILGRAERVYANDAVLLLTQTDYRYTYDAGSTEQTVIHRFDLGDGADVSYLASGAVPGQINDQFSLDERDGVIRVSTTIQPSWRFGGGTATSGVSTPPPSTNMPAPARPTELAPADTAVDAPASDAEGVSGMTAPGANPAPPDGADPVPDVLVDPAPTPAPPPEPGTVAVSRVITLVPDGDALVELGSTDDFGLNEQIYATRFIGDRGYVVTFRRTDPLFVIDLSVPSDPHIVGELHIPGFSNYLFPLDDDHLFAIGQDATADGVVQGLALQAFDVTDPTQPTLSAKYVYAGYGDSPANVDHRAITFHPDRNVVAFPHRSYETGESTLDLFEVRFDGISPVGSVGMGDEIDIDQCLALYYGKLPEAELAALKEQLAADPQWQREVIASCGYNHYFRRGLFRDDFVYGISNTGMYVYDMTQMGAGAVSTLALPAEVYASGNYGGPTIDLPVAPAPTPSSPPSQGAGGASGSEEKPEPAQADPDGSPDPAAEE